ncbi:hypothetical protein ZWY2020_057560 [Hordeum vulgare]|nr:hypothetical protein ZWY2020_057560 [Hordeum vulgare]
MDALPDGVVQTILSRLSSARDVAACGGVSRCWRDCVPFLPALYFPRSAFDARGVACADAAIGRMVQAAARLEELVIYCPSPPRTCRSGSPRAAPAARARAPRRRRRLPHLTDLALLGCECSGTVFVGTPLLQRCRLDFVGSAPCALALAAPLVESREVQGFSYITLQGGDRLKRLTISKNTDRLPVLEQLSLRGVQWSWGAVSHVLQCGAEAKHLVMKVEFCGDSDTLQPFPEVDLVEFFNSHPKLCKFEVHGAMFASLCQKNSLKNLDSRFLISSLEEVLITVRSPLNAEQKLITIESLVRYSPRLRRMVLRISQMKNCHEAADEFFEEVSKFAHLSNGRVRIE